jgi:50S ribosomal subunit-associated GTPase HflX
LTVSAKTGEGLDELREVITRELAWFETPDDDVAYPGEDQQ